MPPRPTDTIAFQSLYVAHRAAVLRLLVGMVGPRTHRTASRTPAQGAAHLAARRHVRAPRLVGADHRAPHRARRAAHAGRELATDAVPEPAPVEELSERRTPASCGRPCARSRRASARSSCCAWCSTCRTGRSRRCWAAARPPRDAATPTRWRRFGTTSRRCTDGSAARLGRHARRRRHPLCRRRARGRIVDVATTFVDTPVGVLLVAAAGDAGHPRRVRRRGPRPRARVARRDRLAPDPAGGTALLATARAQLEEYFAAARDAFDVPIDLRLARGPVPAPGARAPARRAVVRPAPMPSWPPQPDARRPSGPSGPAVPPIPCRSSCRATGCCAPGASWAVTSAVERKRWLLEHERGMVA